MNNTEHENDVDKSWSIPAAEGHGPVTMTLRLPEVRITDPEGRFIVISPRQSELAGEHLINIAQWLRYGDRRYQTDGDQG